MRYTTCQIMFQEVPSEISISFSISGCKMKCKGCHSNSLWDDKNGTKMDKDVFLSLLQKYDSLISCVLFYGGEWDNDLIGMLDISRKCGLKTCLYTGLDNIVDVDSEITKRLSYIKVGRWKEELGGLNNPLTNQRLYDLDNKKDITHKLQRK